MEKLFEEQIKLIEKIKKNKNKILYQLLKIKFKEK
jgi:hypothetical protein